MRPSVRSAVRPSVGSSVPLPALAYWDFTTGGSFQDLNYANLVAGCTSRDGLQTVSSNVARASPHGLLVTPQYANKCVNTNWEPSNTDGTTPGLNFTVHEPLTRGQFPQGLKDELDVIDPQGNVTGGYLSECSAADTITVDGPTGNTNTHTASVRVFALSGDPGVTVTGGASVRVSGLNQLERLENVLTGAGTAVLTMTATQASEFIWFDNNLTETAGRFSSVKVDQSAVTQLGDAVSAPIPAGLNVNNFAVVTEFQAFLLPVAPNDNRITHIDSGANTNGTKIEDVIVNTNNLQQVRDGVVNVTGPAYPLDAVRTHVYGVDGTTLRYVIDGVEQTPTATLTPPGGYTTIRFGTRATGDRQLTGYIRRVAIYTNSGAVPVIEQFIT